MTPQQAGHDRNSNLNVNITHEEDGSLYGSSSSASASATYSSHPLGSLGDAPLDDPLASSDHHRDNNNNNSNDNSNNQKRYVCTFAGCTKAFNRRDYLRRHAANHLDVKPFFCKPCGKHFARNDLYENHLTTKLHKKRSNLHDGYTLGLDHLAGGNNGSSSARNHHPVRRDRNRDHLELMDGGFAKVQTSLRSQQSPSQAQLQYNKPYGLQSNDMEHIFPHAFGFPDPLGSAPGTNTATGSPHLSAHMGPPQLQSGSHSGLHGGIQSDSLHPFLAENDYSPYGPGDLSAGSNSATNMDAFQGGSFQSFIESQGYQQKQLLHGPYSQVPQVSHAFIPPLGNGQMHQMHGHPSHSQTQAQAQAQMHSHQRPGQTGYHMGFDSYSSTGGNEHSNQQNCRNEFAWLFDDRDISSEFRRYDIDYMQKLRYYESRAASIGVHAESGSLIEPATIISTDKLRSVLKVLCCHPDTPSPAQLGLELTPVTVSLYITMVWKNVHALQYFLHPVNFNAETECDHLLAMMIILGMAMSNSNKARQLASKAVVSIFSTMRSGLERNKSIDLERDIGYLQTFGLLVRFEQYIHIRANSRHEPSNISKIIQRKWLIEKFLPFLTPETGLENNVGPSGNASGPKDEQNNAGASASAANAGTDRFKHGHVTRAGYTFVRGADPRLAWKEWVAYESCKRATFFSLYCDCVDMLCGYRTESAISLLEVDIQMPCAQCLWLAKNEVEFFGILGLPAMVNNVPYLHLLKSMFRMPRLGEEESIIVRTNIDKKVWSLFTLMSILYGLLAVSRQMTFVYKSVEEILQRMQMINYRTTGLAVYEHSVQERLSRAFDIWNFYYDTATGLHETSFPFTNDTTASILSINTDMSSTMLSHLRKAENACILGNLQTNPDSILRADYVLISLMHNYASQIIMYDDLALMLSAGNNIPLWLASYRSLVPNSDVRKAISQFINMSEFDSWAGAYGSRTIVSTACLYMVRSVPANDLIVQNEALCQLLGKFTYYCIIMIWIYSLTLPKNSAIGAGWKSPDYHRYEQTAQGVTMVPEPAVILKDSTRYLFYIWSNLQRDRRDESVPAAGPNNARAGVPGPGPGPNNSTGPGMPGSRHHQHQHQQLGTDTSFTSELVIYDANGAVAEVITARCLTALGWYLLRGVRVGSGSQTGSELCRGLYEELYLNAYAS